MTLFGKSSSSRGMEGMAQPGKSSSQGILEILEVQLQILVSSFNSRHGLLRTAKTISSFLLRHTTSPSLSIYCFVLLTSVSTASVRLVSSAKGFVNSSRSDGNDRR